MIDPQSLAAGLVLAAIALAKRMQAGEELGDYPSILAQIEQLQRATRLGALPAVTLTTAGQPQKILDENLARKGVVFQKLGITPIVRVATRREDLTGSAGGLELVNESDAIIDGPDPHVGEWWAVADTNGTQLIVGEIA